MGECWKRFGLGVDVEGLLEQGSRRSCLVGRRPGRAADARVIALLLKLVAVEALDLDILQGALMEDAEVLMVAVAE